tara:strand:- start:4140 stop:4727 length:588 start_codon:yes stop_codon:yes gene_type:complete
MKHTGKIINLLKSNSRGFTLIELVLTVIAIGIFGAITANILGNASKVYESTLKKQKFVSEARHSFFRLNRDFNLQTWAMNDDISNPKSLNIESANGWQLQYDLQTNNNLRLNLIQHSNLSPTSEVLSKNTHYPSSNISYYDNQNNIVSDSYNSSIINLAKIRILFNDPTNGYSMNIESYAYPYNFKFGKPMDYHD